MNRYAKRTGVIAGVHLAITLLLLLAMRQLPFESQSDVGRIVWDIVYSLWMAVLQPLAAVAIRVERLGIRLPDSWIMGAVLLALNSIFVGAALAAACVGVLRIIRIRKWPTTAGRADAPLLRDVLRKKE
jgi:hypothetical protein